MKQKDVKTAASGGKPDWDALGRKYLRITEFARIAGTSRKTLQYYDELGLFCPAFVGENGYRWYSPSQLDRLALISALRDMGLSLKEIRSYLEQGDGERLNRLLALQSSRVDRMIARLRQRKAMLNDALADNRLFQALWGQGVREWEWPPQRAARLTDMESGRSYMVNYLTEGRGVGLCVEEEGQFLYQKREDGALLIPGGRYLCLCEPVEHVPQERVPSRLAWMRSWAEEHGVRLDGSCFVEYNDLLLPREDGREFQLRLLRVRILDQ